MQKKKKNCQNKINAQSYLLAEVKAFLDLLHV